MQTGQQAQQAAAVPEIPPVSELKESKRGGRRPGAARKPNLAKRLLKAFSHRAIAEAVATVDVGAVVTGLLRSKREKIRLETLAFLRDTLVGRPAQNVSISGGMLHAHTIWRPLESLTDEEIRLLDTITKKLTAPVSSASPDTPGIQTESKPAIEAAIVESQPIPVPDSREPARRPESMVQVSASDGEVMLESQEPRSIMEALNRPTREPICLGESLGNWRR